MIEEKTAVYMTIGEFIKIPKKQLVVKYFTQKPDNRTTYHAHYQTGKQIFIKPSGRATWN